MITINNQQSTIKNSRLHLIACNRNELSASHALHTARHFMHHFASFHVAFRIISCHISYISLHTSHTLHTSLHRMTSHVIVFFTFREQCAFHALHYTLRHFMYHFMSFSHEISYHTHSYHLGVKRVENGSKRHTLQLSTT